MDKLRRQILKFILVGIIAFLIDYGLLLLFTEVFGMYYIISACASFSISLVFNFIASIIWVFDLDESKDKKVVFLLFLVLSMVGLGMNQAILWVGVEYFGIYYMVMKVIATAMVTSYNYVSRKYFLE